MVDAELRHLRRRERWLWRLAVAIIAVVIVLSDSKAGCLAITAWFSGVIFGWVDRGRCERGE